MKVLLTGGAGYLGSITATALLEAGHQPVVLDSLVTGPEVFTRDRICYHGTVGDRAILRRIVGDHPDISCTIHMAARVAVTESVADPMLYYCENVAQTLVLLDELVALGKPDVVVASSASVYGFVPELQVDEDSPLSPVSPYARTKQMVEQAVTDAVVPGPLRAVILRIFNPLGSDPHLRHGVYSRSPSQVTGQLAMASLGRIPTFRLFGTDLPTPDGTSIRDYVHVWDVARAHVAAVERFDAVVGEAPASSVVVNIGSGRGVTVRELIGVYQQVAGRRLTIDEQPSRPGEAVGAFANIEKARRLLAWEPAQSLEDGVRSNLAWMAGRQSLLGYE